MLIWRGFDPFRLYHEWRAYLGKAPRRPHLQVVVSHRPRRDGTEFDRAAAGGPTKRRSGTESERAQDKPPPRRRDEASLRAGAG